MNTMINEHAVINYLVMLDNKVLTKKPTKQLAESFVNSLDVKMQESVRIVPATDDGQQILFG